MACRVGTWYKHTVFTILLVISSMKTLVVSEPQVPCYFIFGDSLFDNGNNNMLVTMAKSNYPPYGVDFLDGPTGRFTNGRTTADLIGELLGFDKFISPFATVKGDEIMRGVNYASGGAGIRDETGLHQGQVLSLNRQLLNHQVTILNLAVLLGSESAAKEYLTKCFHFVGMGNNDYLNNCLLSQYYPTSSMYSPDQFAAVLIQQYSKQLKGRVVSMNRQLLNHQVTILNLAVLLRNESAAKEYLNKCFYLVGMGNNDYLNNYLLPQFYPTSSQYSPDQFATVLIQQYSKQLKTLYNLGARKVAVVSLGPVGYIPMYSTNKSARERVNNLVQQFDDKLKTLVDDHNSDLSDAKFIYINTTSIASGDPSSVGITVVDAPCCKVSTSGQCVPGEVPCSNRAEHAFYDAMHPSEISNQVKASRAYSALLPTDAYPFDISHLLQHFNSGIKEAVNDIIDFDRQLAS